jgi:ABC-type branched-subunit amino acid transport system substrate-binding protein
MRHYRPGNISIVLFIILFLAGCAKMPWIGEVLYPPAPAPEKTAPAPVVKPETKMPEDAKKPDAKAQAVPAAGALPGDREPAGVKPAEEKYSESEKQVPPAPAVVSHRNKIGCILPLSGRFAEAGNKALDAILLSADLFNPRHPVPWKIIVTDSGESQYGMEKAVAYLADQAHVTAIVAIAGSSEAPAAAIEAEKRKVPLILITSREGITEGRDYVFQHFLTPTQQMQAIARYSLDHLNVAIFSILYPKDDYGDEMVRLFRREIQKVGGKVNKAISYTKAQTDFSEQIGQLTGQKLERSGKSFATPQEARTRMLIDFEALFIPDSHLRLKMITSQLAFYDVKGFRILGTSLWHSPDLLKKGTEYLEGAIFADSFLVNGFLPETNDFVDVYYSAFRREPENIEALAYDTMEIVLGILEDDKVKSREDFVQSLLGVDRYQGATGMVSFRGNHVARKNAFIIKIQNGKLEQVK